MTKTEKDILQILKDFGWMKVFMSEKRRLVALDKLTAKKLVQEESFGDFVLVTLVK